MSVVIWKDGQARTTWGDVARVVSICGLVLLLVITLTLTIVANIEIQALRIQTPLAYRALRTETDKKIQKLQKEIQALKAAQRPLVVLDGGKYVSIFARENEVFLEAVGERIKKQ